MYEERDDGGFLSGMSLFLTGAIVGAMAALLYAPRSGEETREQIGGWISDKGERGRNLVGRLRDKIPHRVREQVQQTAEQYGVGEQERRI